MPVNMPSKMEEGDEYDVEDFEETETMISREKSNRPVSAIAKKSSKLAKRISGMSHKRRAQSATLTRTSRERWINAMKKGQTLMAANGRQSPRHKTPIEYWVETLRKTGSGISTESTGMNTFTGLKKANEKYYPYMSTSHFMRQIMGTEKPSRFDDPTVRPSPGRPNYKTPEEYYDEVLELRKQIAALNIESGTMKTKIRRLEEDNMKKEKEIESLLNPGMSEEIRRTLGDRKPESGAVIHSLKQKILKLETQLRDRESAYNKLQADLKVTKVEELRGQMEVMYQEIVRLQHCKDSNPSAKGGHENMVRVKALNETILRLSKANEQLLQENKALKEDLAKAFERSDTKTSGKREYEDMDRKQMLIRRLESHGELADKEVDSDALSVVSVVSGREGRAGSVGASKIVLQGNLEERLTQLDHRETELLEEIQRLKLNIKRLREEKRKRADDKTEKSSLPPTPRQRSSRSESGSLMGSRRVSRQESVVSDTSSAVRKVNEFKEKHAALSIQRQWRQHRQQQELEERVKSFQENHAARKIQNEWLKHKNHQYEAEDAAYLIQSALKAHDARRAQMRTHMNDEDSVRGDDYGDGDDDDDVFLIQSSIKGQRARVNHMKHMREQWYNSYEDEDHYYDTEPVPSRRPSVQRPSSAKRKPDRQMLNTKLQASSSNARPSVDDDDDDDDIMF